LNLAKKHVGKVFLSVSLQAMIEQTVGGLGYQLVDIERSAGGLLRITIDQPWSADAPVRFVNIEDCEKVTRQLQYVLEVEAVEYRRLEVSSPGIDRPLKSPQDFERFVGQLIDITFKDPVGAAAFGMVHANRKKFTGRLRAVSECDPVNWQIEWTDEPKDKPGQRLSKKRVAAPLQVLAFQLSELREARLSPIVNFKGRSSGPAA
jgi:ribosome maturation factor RimP